MPGAIQRRDIFRQNLGTEFPADFAADSCIHQLFQRILQNLTASRPNRDLANFSRLDRDQAKQQHQ